MAEYDSLEEAMSACESTEHSNPESYYYVCTDAGQLSDTGTYQYAVSRRTYRQSNDSDAGGQTYFWYKGPECEIPAGNTRSLSVPDPAAIGFEACFSSCTFSLGGPSAYEEDAQGNVISWTFYEAASTGEYCETSNASEGGQQDDDGDDGNDDGGDDGGDGDGGDGGDDGSGDDDGTGDDGDGSDDGSDDGSGDDGSGDDGSDDGNGSGGGSGDGEGEGDPVTWSGEEIDLTLSDTDEEYDQVMNDYKQKIQDIKNEVQAMFGTNLSGGGSVADDVHDIKGVPVNFSLNRFLDGLNILGAVVLFCAAFISAGILFTGRG
ncbi:hypothetical protein [Marinobacter sp. LN3S78]|uniref:hypothetical protein n=1 Tax=Marinobacter sp. LN3S78 TaxID=3382300 RepID=UPI00387B3350